MPLRVRPVHLAQAAALAPGLVAGLLLLGLVALAPGPVGFLAVLVSALVLAIGVTRLRHDVEAPPGWFRPGD